MRRSWKIAIIGLMASSAAWLAAPASAAPMSSPMGLRTAAAPSVETVQFRRWGPGWGWRGGGWGWRGGGFVPGVVAGGIIGGAIAAAQPYGYYGYGYDPGYAYADPGYAYADPGYAYAPGYAGYAYAPGYTYAPSYGYSGNSGYAYAPAYGDSYAASTGGDDVSYCQQRFRSYDPRSGTYLGYDGRRHPCP